MKHSVPAQITKLSHISDCKKMFFVGLTAIFWNLCKIKAKQKHSSSLEQVSTLTKLTSFNPSYLSQVSDENRRLHAKISNISRATKQTIQPESTRQKGQPPTPKGHAETLVTLKETI